MAEYNHRAPENPYCWVKSLINNCKVYLLLSVATQVAEPKCALIMTKEENNSLVLGETGKQRMTSTWHQAPTKAKGLS